MSIDERIQHFKYIQKKNHLPSQGNVTKHRERKTESQSILMIKKCKVDDFYK